MRLTRNLSRFNKVLFFFNIVLTVVTFLAYVLPFLAPKFFPLLSVVTLVLPLFLVLNGLYFLYWLLQLKKQIIISGLVLLIGITFVNKFYKFSGIDSPKTENDFIVMSYNVRLLNLFKWIDNESVPYRIEEFINEKNPDILCLQEYSASAKIDLKIYPHRYIYTQGKKIKSAQAIFSKFPIISEGYIKFPNSDNNAVYADIKKGKDIIRVYNIHLESIKISPDVNEMSENMDEINQQKSEDIFKRISKAFTKQQQQAELIMNHKTNCKFPIIICGDMNNSAFSYVYRSIRGSLKDTFEEAGLGFGKTYNFKHYPARIDYIFADKTMKIKSFESFSDFKNSDHFPIMTRLAVE